VLDLRVELDSVELGFLWRTAAKAQFLVEASTSNSLVLASTLSPWLIQPGVVGDARKSFSLVFLTLSSVAAVFAFGGGGDLGAQHLGAELEAVADTQDGDAEIEDLWGRRSAPCAGRRSRVLRRG